MDNELENQFLIAQGISDPEVRKQIITAGLDVSSLDPSLTPAAFARFEKIIVDRFKTGKPIRGGPFGNIYTRVATINKAAELEINGFDVAFEYKVVINKEGNIRFIDIVQIDPDTEKIIKGIQLVKRNRKGKIIRPDELDAAKQIEQASGIPIEFLNTQR